MGFCTKCGAQLRPDAVFCASCGTRVESAPQAQDNAQAQYESVQPAGYGQTQAQYAYAKPGYAQPKPGRGKLIALLCVAGAVVVATAVLLIVFLGGGASVKPEKLNGTWVGQVTIKEVTQAGTELGLTVTGVGETQDADFFIDLDKNGDGTLDFEGKTFTAKLRGGSFTASGDVTMYEKNVVFSLTGGVKQKGETYTIEGTWTIKGDSKLLVSGVWSVEIK